MDVFAATHFILSIELARKSVPSFDQYPFNLPAVRALHSMELHPGVTFIIGENGSGKSTLLEAVAVSLGLNAEGGSRNFNFATRRSHSNLCDFLLLRKGIKRPRGSWFLRAESFFNVATEIERLDGIAPPSRDMPSISASYGGGSLHEQSHGESFFALFENRFGEGGLYLLDEPEAALSPTRQMSFLTLLHDHVKAGSQFIIATHSPIIMAFPQAFIYVLGGEQIRRVPYKETEHYTATKNFLDRPEKMLEMLLRDEE